MVWPTNPPFRLHQMWKDGTALRDRTRVSAQTNHGTKAGEGRPETVSPSDRASRRPRRDDRDAGPHGTQTWDPSRTAHTTLHRVTTKHVPMTDSECDVVVLSAPAAHTPHASGSRGACARRGRRRERRGTSKSKRNKRKLSHLDRKRRGVQPAACSLCSTATDRRPHRADPPTAAHRSSTPRTHITKL